ncbi:MAG: amidase family protein, partial [Candidatus Woesearchaeota archaeon]|nr:amidase family protein [Candidatus Woesearchaeota archaeon]
MKDYIQKMQTGGDIVSAITAFVEESKKINEDNHYFTVITEAQAIEQAKNIQKQALTKKFPLAGLPFTVKDGICVQGVETTASSAILKGYKPVFNATAVQRMIDAGAIFIGKTVQDEFGFGALGITQGKGFQAPKHPDDPELCCGGSSSGGGGFTKKIPGAHASLGESTGGSIEAPAAFCGVVGLCPTYSRVSRYGLLDYGTSLDKIGPLTKTLPEAATILQVIAGHDKKDETSSQEPVPDYAASLGNIKGLRIAKIKEAFAEGVDESIKNSVHEKLTELEKQGATVREVSLPSLKEGIATYFTIALSEASTNLAKYCGMRYGQSGSMNTSFDEYFTKIRTHHMGEEAKRRVLI